MALCAGTN
jgi:hypothetical protein